MSYRIFLLLLVIICISYGLTSCSSPTSNNGVTSEPKADIEGKLLEIYPAGPSDRENGLLGAVLVEGKMQESRQITQVSVAVKRDTRLLQQDGQSHRPLTFDALAVGQSVQVTFRGPVAESYPMQATADEIVVIQ